MSNSELRQLTSEIVKDLSNDQFYAYKICQAVILGAVDEDLKQLHVAVYVG